MSEYGQRQYQSQRVSEIPTKGTSRHMFERCRTQSYTLGYPEMARGSDAPWLPSKILDSMVSLISSVLIFGFQRMLSRIRKRTRQRAERFDRLRAFRL